MRCWRRSLGCKGEVRQDTTGNRAPAVSVADVIVAVTEPILAADNLSRHFAARRGILFGRSTGTIRAVDGIAFRMVPVVGSIRRNTSRSGSSISGTWP
jgi:hypothetical protein